MLQPGDSSEHAPAEREFLLLVGLGSVASFRPMLVDGTPPDAVCAFSEGGTARVVIVDLLLLRPLRPPI